jgi:radical SAM superfamily enzyme YgiQ (UPF0313 family)
MKIACVSINSLDNYSGIPKWKYSLSFAYLQSYYTLSQFYGQTQFVNIVKDVNADDRELTALIAGESPDIAAFSCYLWNTSKIIRILPKIRKSCPGAKIIIGGPECTYDLVGLLKSKPYFDILVKGEGEAIWKEILDALHENGSFPHAMNGIIYFDKVSRRFIENPDAEPLKDINAIPSPYLNGIIDVAKLASSIIGIETQRGCAYHCGYCSYPKGSQGIRYFDAGRIERELDLILSAQPRQLYLMDPMFNSDKNRAKAILRHIAQKNSAQKTIINTEVLLDTMDEELFGLAGKAGVKSVEVGIQSFNAAAIRNLHRYRNEEKLIENMNLGLKHGLNLIPQIIYGLPGDSLGDFFDSFDRMYAFDVKEFDLFRLLVLPGTEFRKKAKRYGIKYDKSPPYEIISNNDLSAKESEYLDLFRKLVLCTAWYRAIIARISRERKTQYHSIFNEFIKLNRKLLRNSIFAWPIHSKMDEHRAVKIIESFGSYLRRLIKDFPETSGLTEREIAKAEDYTKRILLFRFLSVSKRKSPR